MKTALSIAGSDSSGGAGIQADIKTITLNGVYAMSAVTALTAQNTMGVAGILDAGAEFLKQQIDAVFEDIVPDAVKIGMVSNSEMIEVIAERLAFYQAKNIVTDPVMVATSGASLIQKKSTELLIKKLFPMSALVTPNIWEGQFITGKKIETVKDMEEAAKEIGDTYGCAVLLKGGHTKENADDLLYEKGMFTWIPGERIDNPNTHGTGCTLSSAIAANLAKGYPLKLAVKKAKEFVTAAIAAGLNLGKGHGPMNHGFDINSRFTETYTGGKGKI